MTNVKVSERELRVLKTLVEHCSEEGYCIPFKYIAEMSGLELKHIRRTVRALARKGLAKYHRGLFDDDGMVAGSGYSFTSEGEAFIEKLRADEETKKEAEEKNRSKPML